MRILVTGDSGFVGSRVVEYLVKSGYIVVGCSRRPSVPGSHVHVCLDLTQRSAVMALDRSFDGIVHLAAYAPIPNHEEQPHVYAHHNMLATQNLLEFAVSAGIRRFVFTSSLTVYAISGPEQILREDDPLMPSSYYAVSKVAAERACQIVSQESALETAILRLGYTYGRGMVEATVLRQF